MALQFELGGNVSKTFHGLDLRAFTAGELEIINSAELDRKEKAGRFKLLQNLLYLAGSYEWSVILQVYAAIVGRIERGLESWQGEFTQIIQMVLAQESHKKPIRGPRPYKSIQGHDFNAGGSAPNTALTRDWAYFSSKFQRNACPELKEHQGNFKGKPVVFQHICAKCWQTDRAKRFHPESAPECPHYKS